MPETVEINKRLGIIQINSSGDLDQRDLYSSLQSVLEIFGKTGIKKVLIDTTEQTQMPTTIELHEFALKLSKQARMLKHAIVVSPRSHEDNYFVETVSVNRGVNMKIFDSVGDALAWLNK